MKFIMKWILNGAIVVLLLMYFADVTFIEAAITASALTIIAYAVGDQLILRATNNTVATIADFGLAFVILWIASYSMEWSVTAGELFIIAAILAIAEWVLHRFIFKPENLMAG